MDSLSIITPYFAENRLRILAGMLSLILVDVLQLIVPLVIKRAIDDLTLLRAAPGDLLGYALAIAAIAVLIGLFRYVWRLCLLGTSRRVEEGLRNRLFAHLQTLSAAYFDRTRTGDLMAHATNDIQQIRMAAGMGLVALNDAVVLGTAAVGFMLAIDPALTGIVLVPMPLIAAGTRYFSRRMHRRYQSVQAAFSDLTEAVRERMAGIRLIKAHNRKAAELEQVRASSQAYVEENLRLVGITGAFFPMMTLFTNISMALVLLYGGRQTILLAITPGDFVAFTSYLALLTWPMMALGWVTNLIQRGRASLERVQAILAVRPEIRSPATPAPSEPADTAIVFEGVGFAYGGSDAGRGAALTGIDLRIEPGAVIGVVGPPGSGKSTLAALLPRLYDPTSGRILIGGRDLRTLRLEQLRRTIAVMPQEPFLFAGTIRDNIAFGDPDVDEERLAAAAREAALLETIRRLPDGFDTVVGERGIMLSGGQKQRVGLARCLLANAAVLVLDDPISQVDFETGAAIAVALRRRAGAHTLIVASHRLSAVRFADRIIVLENGRATHVGSHAELLAASRYYAETCRLQEMEEAYGAD
ncbi:MAG: ABC transporter ATP-binding protein/permease [Desulfobacterales bacterium]|jgi:ATP-binding cassette subfamily B protein|nr:ABC transporter ATP-binding protein/permease [Desulfobacterales bacterium]